MFENKDNMQIYNINKPQGQTPLEALETLRKKMRIAPSARLTYAGRLDPMASGVLLILKDATQDEREKFLALDKTYETKILLGISSDSWDLLGLPKKGKTLRLPKAVIIKYLNQYHLMSPLPVPFYSSVPYCGKPLFEWARAGKIKEKKLPLRQMAIKDIKLEGLAEMSAKNLLKTVESSINKIKGDFRQEKILKTWQKLLVANPDRFQIAKLKISCGSGTYIRSIAHNLGKKLKTGALVYSLKRLSVGKYHLNKSVKL